MSWREIESLQQNICLLYPGCRVELIRDLRSGSGKFPGTFSLTQTNGNAAQTMQRPEYTDRCANLLKKREGLIEVSLRFGQLPLENEGIPNILQRPTRLDPFSGPPASLQTGQKRLKRLVVLLTCLVAQTDTHVDPVDIVQLREYLHCFLTMLDCGFEIALMLGNRPQQVEARSEERRVGKECRSR